MKKSLRELAKILGYSHTTYSKKDPVSVVTYSHSIFNLTVKSFFSDKGPYGKPLAIFQRIEYQGRGAPHLHLLAWLDEEI
jgi:hypothetical protein